MKIINEQKNSNSISIAEVDKFPEQIYQHQVDNWLTTDYPFLPWRQKLIQQEKEKLKILEDNLKDGYKLRIALSQNLKWGLSLKVSKLIRFMELCYDELLS